MKNGTSKSENVDAYFVDTLNKSMAEKDGPDSLPIEPILAERSVEANQGDVENGHQECTEKSASVSRTYTPNKAASNDSSSDSCGSTFVPVKSTMSDGCHTMCERPARSNSMCSMPELVNCSFPHFIMNSESMPNITSKAAGRKLLYASQLTSSTSLSESDNMSEQSGYVSSHQSSAGSTNQVTPAGRHIFLLDLRLRDQFGKVSKVEDEIKK